MRAAFALAAVMLAGCPGLVVHSPRNAPGHVDLATPPAHEVGDPGAYEAPADPGEHRAMVLPGGFAAFGAGRRFSATELGVQLRFTFAEAFETSAKQDEYPFVWSAWGAAFGWGIVQLSNDDTAMHAAIGGPLYAEVNRTWSVFGAGAGVAVYPDRADQVDVGPQLTAWAGAFVVRARFMTDTGAEVFAGYQLELPTVWTWSR